MQNSSPLKHKDLLESAVCDFFRGNTKNLEELIQSGFDINIRLDDNTTALMEAVRAADIYVVRLLVEAGADVNAETGGYTALWDAAYWGLQEIFDYLAPLTSSQLRQKAEEILSEGLLRRQRLDDTLTEDFISAAAMGNVEAVIAAIQSGVNVNAIGSDENPALTIAAYWGRVAVVKLLLEHKADANCFTEDQHETPLTMAAQGAGLARFSHITSVTTDDNQVAIIELLLAAGADVNVRTKKGWTALANAAVSGSIRAVKLLLEAGADINAKDIGGYTALSRAKQEKNQEIIQLLLECGAKED
ncbi:MULTISPECIES: ankyrin repeat domain-containing protein [unclassified Microcoleus]|uniref:ankyrin repeat domain-containing protein n=1 Tax=unclassified Microcoleus TaxID=2642155 RepID=UPI002FD4C965